MSVPCVGGGEGLGPRVNKFERGSCTPVLSLSSETEFHRKPPPIALSAVACININLL